MLLFCFKELVRINFLGWLRGKKETIINDDNDFQNALDDTLNYQNFEKQPQRISKLKPYINKYNWEGIKFRTGPKKWIKFDRHNKTIPLNVLYVQYKTKIISVEYRSEYNSKHKKQVTLLMITNGKKYHYLAITNLSTLLQGMSSNHRGDFYCLNFFNSYTTENKVKEHEEIRNNHDSYHIEMPKQAEI